MATFRFRVSETPISRRDAVRVAAVTAVALAGGVGAAAEAADTLTSEFLAPPSTADLVRLRNWAAVARPLSSHRAGMRAVRVGELAVGTPYKPATLESYLAAGGDPTRKEPLTLSLTEFDCVTLVEACLAVARLARRNGTPTWALYAHEVERMRYRGGERKAYSSRLHYFSEWIQDGSRRGLVLDIGKEIGGAKDARPLRFMSVHRASYPALANATVFREIEAMERGLDSRPRYVVPVARIPDVQDRIQTGDVLAFATSIDGLDVTHSAFAYRDGKGILRVLHAPLSGGAVEVTRTTLPEYVAAIRRATGILIARPLG